MDDYDRQKPLKQPIIDDFRPSDLQMLAQSHRFLTEEQQKIWKEYQRTNSPQTWIEYKVIESDIRFCENGINNIIRKRNV